LKDRSFYVVLVFFLFILLQLVPLPHAVLKHLSPYSAHLYKEAQEVTSHLNDDSADGPIMGSISLDRDKTIKTLFALWAYASFALLTLASFRRSRDLQRFALILMI
jgi:hypothetical protein